MFRVRQLFHDLLTGMVFRPLLITLVITLAGIVLVELEARGLIARPEDARWFFSNDSDSGRAVLQVIAGSMMAVISIVYSVLLVALSLASTQFSPRILGSFISDRASQRTLGIFLGTFLYSLLVLRAIEDAPPYVPTWGVAGACVLGLLCLMFLIRFIQHIATNIQAPNLVAHIARETHGVIVAELSARPTATHAPPPGDALVIEATDDGFLQLVDYRGLAALARKLGVTIHVAFIPGSFVSYGGVLARVESRHAVDAISLAAIVRTAFVIGPMRTMQQDVAFGFRQLVDIALKAISPAVNDPTTASTCVAHLGALLADVARHHAGPRVIADGTTARVVIPQHTFCELADLAFDQIRQYGHGDLTVSIRLLSAICVALHAATSDADRAHLRQQADLIRTGLSPQFIGVDRQRFEDHWARCMAAV